MKQLSHIFPRSVCRCITATLPLVLLFTLPLLSSCTADWNDHYDRSASQPTETLMDLIAADPQLSTFATALRQTGFDKLLSADQTYTVWAPTNEALAALDLQDAAAVRRLVGNHIARFANPSSSRGRIKMLGGKTMSFTSATSFAGATVAQADVAAKNGVLHKLAEQIPYKFSIRELIDSDPRFSQLAAFIAQFDTTLYDPDASTTYDSVFIPYNPLLEDLTCGIGSIGSEDSTFTMILPTDEAWQAEFERVKPAFNTFAAEAAVADSIQHSQTGQAILRGLTFRGLADLTADSLLTVSGCAIRPVARYFAGYERVEASNGVMFVATTLNTADTCIWNRQLVTEAENMDSRVPMSGTNCFIRNTDANSPVTGISENSYLEINSGNVDGGVTFDIPNALSTTYDIYVDFVNPVVDGASLAEERTKVSFQLRYRGANGRATAVNANTPIEIGAMDADGEMLPGIISVRAFEHVTLPVTDFYDGLWFLQDGHAAADITEATTLQVRTRVTSAEARAGYVRKFRVDRVRFVPVTD